MLNNSPIDIHFGIQDASDPEIFKFQGLTFHSFDLLKSAYTLHKFTNSKFKDFIITSMGPVCDILSLFCVKKLIQKSYEKNKKNFTTIYLYNFFDIMVSNTLIKSFFYGFTPLYQKVGKFTNSDGYKFCEFIGINKEFLDKINSFDEKLNIIIPLLVGIYKLKNVIISFENYFKNLKH